jgi:4-oxalomesaconate tautomerase
MQQAIPYMQFRGGSSKGLFFEARHLPADETQLKALVLAAMEGHGQGDPRQIDGLGGAHSLSSKVAVVSLSAREDADLDYFFLQVVPGKGEVATGQSCGNILAAVPAFAIEAGMIPASDPLTAVRVHMVNTGGICEVVLQTPGGQVEYAGNARVDGVPGTAAPVLCHYLDTAGSTCGALLPTGKALDLVDGTDITCIDNGMPEVLLRAADLGISGYETPAELDANTRLKEKLERIRLIAGPLMGLSGVGSKTIPKMCLLAPPIRGGAVHTRSFIPHVCHDAIGVLGAVSVASACVIPGTVAAGIARIPGPVSDACTLSIEHPSGEFTVALEGIRQGSVWQIGKSGVMRTARLLSRGVVYVV